MSKRLGIILGVIVILLIFGVVAFMRMQKSASTQTETIKTPQTAPQNPTSDTVKGTIQGLLTAGRNVTCEINNPEQNSTGTIYITGNEQSSSASKFRGDFNVLVNNQPTNSHMIQADGFGYFWNDSSKQGTKINLEEAKKLTQSSPTSGQSPQQTTDLDKEQEMKCSAWSGDQSKFTLPADVQFSDLSQTLKNIPKTTGTKPKIDPAICNQITDPAAKASCLKSLSGN